MTRYRKLPVEVEAMRFMGSNWREIEGWSAGAVKNAKPWKDYDPSTMDVVTLEGTMLAIDGDWIIRGVAGEFYPCKPDIFHATYEAVSDDD